MKKRYYDPKWDLTPHETSDLWKKALYRLMKDFCFSKNIAMRIIQETEQELLLVCSGSINYNTSNSIERLKFEGSV